MTRRVFVTGVGVVSAIGFGYDSFIEQIRAGKSGVRKLGDMGGKKPRMKVAAQILDFDDEALIDKKLFSLTDRFTRYALVATDEALAMAKVDGDVMGRIDGNCAVIFGTGIGGWTTIEDSFRAHYEEGRSREHPMAIPRVMPSAPSSLVSMVHGIHGPSFTVSSACASSNHAMGTAFGMVRSGLTEMAITGGAEAGMTFTHLRAWEALKVCAPERCAPFSKGRTGMVVGEGAGTLVLESEAHMRARGRRPGLLPPRSSRPPCHAGWNQPRQARQHLSPRRRPRGRTSRPGRS